MRLTPIERAPEPTYPTFASRLARGLAAAAGAAAAVTLLCQPVSAEERVRTPGEMVAVTPPAKPLPPTGWQAPIVVTPTPVKPPVNARLPGRIAPIVPTR